MNERTKSSNPRVEKKKVGRKPIFSRQVVYNWKAQIDQQLQLRDKYISDWLEEQKEGSTIFTKEQILFLGVLAEKNLRNEGYKQGLTDDEEHYKSRIREQMRNAISDIDRMIQCGFLGTVGTVDHWNPSLYDNRANRAPIDPKLLKNDFPAKKVEAFIEALVGMYGDEYAIPFADAIRKGLETKEGHSSKYDIDVPVLRRARRLSF